MPAAGLLGPEWVDCRSRKIHPSRHRCAHFPRRVGVNWCEAYAYCAWANRRLCGAPTSGSTPYNSYASSTDSLWYNACSAQANSVYPYGAAYVQASCNGDDPVGAPIAVQDSWGYALASTCQGGSPGLYHMSGNVREWEDSCDGSLGSTDNCRSRGGDYSSDSNGLRCDANNSSTRSYSAGDLGFRCCL